MGGQRFFTVRIALVVEEHIARGVSGRHFAKIDRRGLAVFGAQQHKAAATQITGLRMRHRQRIPYGDRSIHGVPALFENIHPNLCGHGIDRGHHPLLRANGMEHILFHPIRYRRGWRGGSEHAETAS